MDSSVLKLDTSKQNIYSLSLTELQEVCKKPYQAKQIYITGFMFVMKRTLLR